MPNPLPTDTVLLESVREVDGAVRLHFDLLSGERVVASCYVEGWDRPGGFVNWVHVAPSHRRQGLATALLQGVIGAAKEAGKVGLALSVKVDNVPARRLYSTLGFTVCYQYDGPQGDYLLTLDLGGQYALFHPRHELSRI